ncbi:ABC transporter permease [Pyrodictium abyssi]|uniref:ABC transporter permease n=1 Tax=Pyrodictium abyssi TaxID=54256 RepID=A0ABM8IYZ5_9CREN|nr:ABC transporter permease [Pyrodictium abyssi]
MPRILRMAVLFFVTSTLLVTAVTYTIARLGLGDPFAGLGAEAALDPVAKEKLESLYGLGKGLVTGYFAFLCFLLCGNAPPSIKYGIPATDLAVKALPYTLVPVLLGVAGAVLLAIAWSLIYGFHVPGYIRFLAFVPSFVYAVVFGLTSWYFGWPPPRVCTCLDKMTVYTLLVLVVSWPRILHMLEGVVETILYEHQGYVEVLRAMGFREAQIRLHIMKIAAAPMAAYTAVHLAMVFERSAIIEPLLGYPGLGLMLYRAVLHADLPLATVAFAVIGFVGVVSNVLGRLFEGLLDPRVMERQPLGSLT